MKKFGMILSLVFILVFTSLVSADVLNISACETLSSSGRTYILQNDVSIDLTDPDDIARGGTCFVIEADNIVLDGNGYSIVGNDSVVSAGILATNVTNITITNFNSITGYTNYDSSAINLSKLGDSLISDITNISLNARGIKADHASGIIFSNLNLSSNTLEGITIENLSDTIFENIVLDSNGRAGLYVRGSDYNKFLNIVLLENYPGLKIRDGHFNNFSGITADSNEVYGVSLDNVFESTFSDFMLSNTINKNGIYAVGLFTTKSSRNTFSNITSNSNDAGGIQVSDNSNSNNFSGITADSNHFFSFKIEDSNNTIVKDLVSSNSWYSVLIDDGSFNNISNLTTTSITKWSIRLQKICSENFFDSIYAQSNANVIDDGSSPLINGFSFVNGSNQIHYNNDYGKIFSDNSSEFVFGEQIKIRDNLVSVDSLINGKNVLANVTLRGINLTGTIGILKDGADCGNECTILKNNETKGVYEFNITSWNNYSLSGCGDGIANNGETYATCPSDVPAPAPTGGSSSGGGSSGGHTEICEEWTVCINGEQTQSCNDGVIIKTRECVAEETNETVPEETPEEAPEETPEDPAFFSLITGAVIGAGGVAQAGMGLLLLLVIVGLYFLIRHFRKRK
jgi:hypothetical protein